MKDNVGQVLREAREASGRSLAQVARETHMREHYLRAIESGEFDLLPSQVQTRGFIRAYAEYLKLDVADLPPINDEYDPLPDSPTEDAPQPPKSVESEEIFQAIGLRLKEQRELLGLTLEDVERHTHLRERYLIALESGDLDKLPSPVQGRGMLNNYCIFLGLDPEPLLLSFAEGLQTQLAATQTSQPEARKERTRPLPAPLRRLFSPDILIGGTLAVFLVIFVLWSAIRIFAMQTEQDPTSTAPSIAEVLLASPTTTHTATPFPASPTSPPAVLPLPTQALGTEALSGGPFPQGGEGVVQVYIAVYQRAWMQVSVDEELQFDGRVIPGSAYAFSGDARVEVRTGNGAGLNIFFNDQNLGPMGDFGQVIHRIYTVQGILTPTATITPTPTETSPATETRTLTPTPRPGEATVPVIP